MSLDWRDDPPPPARHQAQRLSAPNRRLVEVIECPTCKSLHVGLRKRTPLFTWWECLDRPTCESWKEPPTAGEQGKASLA